MTGIIWARESNQHDKNEYSIQSQVDACRKLAEKQRVPIVRTFIEKFSGRDLHRMPRLTEMRRLLEATDGPKVIYVYAQDRLVRGEDAFDIFYLLVEFRRHNAEVRFILNPVDLSNIAGQIQMLIAGHEASGEIAKILDRTQRGKIKRMQLGLVYGSGVEKYGYRRDKSTGTVSVHPDEAAVLQRAGRMILDDGMSLSQVCRQLNAEGIPSPMAAKGVRSGIWSNASLGRLLKDTAYKGEGYGHRYAKSHDGKTVNYANRANWIPLPVYPPIFSESDWNQLQEAIRQKRQAHKRNERYPALLRGLVICGECSRRMTYQIDRRNPAKLRTFYECKDNRVQTRATVGRRGCKTPRIREGEIDPIVWDTVMQVLTAPQFLLQAVEQWATSESHQALEAEAAALHRQMERKAEQQANLVGQLADTPPSVAHLLHERLAAIESEKLALADALTKIERQLSARPTIPADRLEAIRESLPQDVPFATKRHLVEMLQIQVLSKSGIWYIYSGLGRIVLKQVLAVPPYNDA